MPERRRARSKSQQIKAANFVSPGQQDKVRDKTQARMQAQIVINAKIAQEVLLDANRNQIYLDNVFSLNARISPSKDDRLITRAN